MHLMNHSSKIAHLEVITASGTSRTITLTGDPILSLHRLACDMLAGNPSNRKPGASGCFSMAWMTRSTTSSWAHVSVNVMLWQWVVTYIWHQLSWSEEFKQSDPPLRPSQHLTSQQVSCAQVNISRHILQQGALTALARPWATWDNIKWSLHNYLCRCRVMDNFTDPLSTRKV